VLDAAARTTTPALATTATVVNPIEEEADDVILTFSSESDVRQHLTAMNVSVVLSATSRAATGHQRRRGVRASFLTTSSM
jgi:c-di-GMP-binding flagellar brake protein YcgR